MYVGSGFSRTATTQFGLHCGRPRGPHAQISCWLDWCPAARCRIRCGAAESDDHRCSGDSVYAGGELPEAPAGESLGESVAVATNSKGHIFVYHRRDTTRLFEFDRNGTFLREIGKGYYGFEFAHSVRVDKDDNIWTVDEGTNMVTKFSPQGKVLMVIGRRPPVVDGPVIAPAGPNPPAQKYILCRPSDVG